MKRVRANNLKQSIDFCLLSLRVGTFRHTCHQFISRNRGNHTIRWRNRYETSYDRFIMSHRGDAGVRVNEIGHACNSAIQPRRRWRTPLLGSRKKGIIDANRIKKARRPLLCTYRFQDYRITFSTYRHQGCIETETRRQTHSLRTVQFKNVRGRHGKHPSENSTLFNHIACVYTLPVH